MKIYLSLIMVLLIVAAPAWAKREKDPTTFVTIYSTAQPGSMNTHQLSNMRNAPGYAMVRTKRDITIPKRESTVQLNEIAALIDPTTVSFLSLTDPDGTFITSQNFLFDLVSQEKLLDRYIDQNIEVQRMVDNQIIHERGTLLSTQGGLTLRQNNGSILALPGRQHAVRFPSLSQGLITSPTLEWEITTSRPGRHEVETSYQTEGLSWWADYNAIFEPGKNANSGWIDLNSWVTIINRSGVDYEEAGLKLLAGNVNRAKPAVQKAYAMEMMSRSAAPDVQEQSLFEFHLYSFEELATLPDNSIKQLQLLPAVTRIAVEKELLFIGQNYASSTTNQHPAVYLQFENSRKNGLEMPLPAGRMRVSMRDPKDQSLEFIGEDVIPHTPKNEEIRIKLGEAFDINIDRTQIKSNSNKPYRTHEESYRYEIANHKDEAVTVQLEEKFNRYANYEITQHSVPYVQKDAKTVRFPVTIPAGGKQEVTFSVRYSW